MILYFWVTVISICGELHLQRIRYVIHSKSTTNLQNHTTNPR